MPTRKRETAYNSISTELRASSNIVGNIVLRDNQMPYDLESVTRELTFVFKSAVLSNYNPAVANECAGLLYYTDNLANNKV